MRVDSELSDKNEVKVRMHQGSVLLHFIFVMEVDVVTEFLQSELLYADNLGISS